MIETYADVLTFSFPEVHSHAICNVDFERTLRIPDDNRPYPLPAGLERFPLHHVDDYRQRLPASWAPHGGVFLPMYQAEALWINFSSYYLGNYPCAVKIAAGKVNVLTGEPWHPALVADPQDYVVVPEQRWLDGYAVGQGLIRQFVAMPLGEGYSAEEQVTASATHGGLQILVYPMKRERYAEVEADRAREIALNKMMFGEDVRFCKAPAEDEMGLAPGGLMIQKVVADPYGLDAWDQSLSARCFVHIVNSLTYHAITGRHPPHKPPTAKEYARAKIPWFTHYAADKKALPGSRLLANLDSLATKFFKKGQGTLPDNDPTKPRPVVSIMDTAKVREGEF